MAQQNTGYARMKTLTVTKGDYTHSYNVTDAFVVNNVNNYSMTDAEFGLLSDEDYTIRMNLFLSYVFSQEQGLEGDCPDIRNGSLVWDPTTCPLTIQG